MKLKRKFQLALAFGVSCGMLGCKAPLGLFSGAGSAHSTTPDVQYNGMSQEFSATVRQNAATTTVSSAKPAPGAVTKAWKSTSGAVSSAFATPKRPPQDATSLNTKPGKLDADIYLQAAGCYEQGGKFKDAESQYQQALKVEPANLKALIGLARLYDRQENSQQAIATYQKAIKLHPKRAIVYNDLGLCYGRRRELAPAQQILQKAVELEPSKANYRNNLATVLVDMGRIGEAHQQLLAVQGEGVAHYNLAFLLNSRGQRDLAIDHLQQAIAKDPTLIPAIELLSQLEGSSRPNMQMASAPSPKRDFVPAPRSQAPQAVAPHTARPASPPRQSKPADLQPPEVSVGPSLPVSSGDETYRISDEANARPQTQEAGLYRRTSHIEEVPVDRAASTSSSTLTITDDEPSDEAPAPIRLTDEDEQPAAADAPSPDKEPLPQEPQLLPSAF